MVETAALRNNFVISIGAKRSEEIFGTSGGIEGTDWPLVLRGYTEMRKQSKHLGMGKKALAKAGGSVRIVYSDVVENLSKVA